MVAPLALPAATPPVTVLSIDISPIGMAIISNESLDEELLLGSASASAVIFAVFTTNVPTFPVTSTVISTPSSAVVKGNDAAVQVTLLFTESNGSQTKFGPKALCEKYVTPAGKTSVITTLDPAGEALLKFFPSILYTILSPCIATKAPAPPETPD